MSVQDNKRFMSRYMADLSGQEKTPELLEKYIGNVELKEHIAVIEAAFPRYELIVEDMVFEGDKVAFRSTFKGNHAGDLMGIPPTGNEVVMAVMAIFRIANNKIVEFSLVSDQLSMMQQVGVLPAMA